MVDEDLLVVLRIWNELKPAMLNVCDSRFYVTLELCISCCKVPVVHGVYVTTI